MVKQRREWITEDAFYAMTDERRVGGEVDFGMCWKTDGAHADGRLTWIPSSGEWYVAALNRETHTREVVRLGRTEPNNREMAERVMSGWAHACLDHKPVVAWASKGLAAGQYDQSYKDDVAAARAYARMHGIQGTGGGWIYGPIQEGIPRRTAEKPICQGWGMYASILEQAGHIRRFGERYHIVDARSVRARRVNLGN